VQEYDTVSTVFAQHSGQLNGAISQLSGATTALADLLTPNLAPLEADVGTVTTAGRTLDRNLGNVDEILAQANNLFEGAQRAYDPNYNWLNLNLALPPGVTGAYEVGLVRDTLAGICRRIYANHASGLSAAVLAELQSCGNPDSTFFDPLIDEIPTILNTLTGSSSSTSATALLQQGLNVIGGITGGTTASAASGASTTKESGTVSGPPTTPTTTTTTTAPPAPTVCSVLGALLGCKAGTSANSSSSSTTSSGVGGLLSEHVSPAAATAAPAAPAAPTPSAARVVSSVDAAPSLTAPAARLLPLRSTPTHRRHVVHRGLLAQWAHDVGSWL
jgi:phage tail protein X